MAGMARSVYFGDRWKVDGKGERPAAKAYRRGRNEDVRERQGLLIPLANQDCKVVGDAEGVTAG